jgi:transposase, IS5 family
MEPARRARSTATGAGPLNAAASARPPRARAISPDRDRGAGVRLQKPHRHRPRVRLLRRYAITHAAVHDGGQLGAVLDRDNTADECPTPPTAQRPISGSSPAGLCARRSIAEAQGHADAAPHRSANARKPAVRSAVEHVFARQKGPIGLFIRTIGLGPSKDQDRPRQSRL